MPLVNGVWVPRLFPKQLAVFNSQARALLVSGPRWSGKTWAVVHKVCRHLWETPGARVALFSKTIKSAKDGGIWDDLVNYAIPEWIEANLEGQTPDITFGYTVEPKIDGQTRTLYFRVRNYYGGESELKLFSLDYDGEVEAKVKGTRFSMIWFSELSNFYDRRVLVTTKQQLRMPHLRLEQHQWIGDTNPAEDGEDSWIYKLWFVEKNAEECPEYIKTEGEINYFRQLQRQLELIEIMLDENDFISEEKKNEVKGDYAFDRELYERYVNGRWYSSTGKDRLFADLYKPNLCLIGDASSLHEDNWDIALPSENCFELICGWDLGDTNHSAHILEKIIVDKVIHWVVLDELVMTGQKCSLEEFTLAFMERMKFAEQAAKFSAGKERKILWRHYSDDSVNRYRSAVDDMDRNLVFRISGGTIDLEGVPKPDGSVMARVHLLRKLLHEGRIKVSAHCSATIQMLKRARRGRTKTEPVLRDVFKHPLDSLTYALIMEMAYEAAAPVSETTKRKEIITIPL